MLTLTLALSLACSRPEPAPENFEEISAWLFARLPDEDPASLAEALDNLGPLLDANVDAVQEGFEVQGLTQADVDALAADQAHTAVGILGVSTSFSSKYSVDINAAALLAVGQDEVHPDTYLAYSREYDGDLDCFLARSCERLTTHEEVTVALPLTGEIRNLTTNELRWIETSQGFALVGRSWLPVHGEANYEWLEVDEQYYLNLFMPVETGVWHIQTSWMVNEQDLIPDATLLSQLVSSMYDLAEGQEAWLDANPTP